MKSVLILNSIVLLFFFYGCSSLDVNKAPGRYEVEDYEEYIKKNVPSETAYQALLSLVKYYSDSKNFIPAAEITEKYKKSFPNHKDDLYKLSDLLGNKRKKFNTVKNGRDSKTEKILPSPSLSSEGAKLFLDPNVVDKYYSQDGRVCVFASDGRDCIGGFHQINEEYKEKYWGNTDIFVTLKTEIGWSLPINLGAMINTPLAERTPYLAPDNKTLFFSSQGHAGLGNFDVYMSKRLSDTSWLYWSEPVNIGKDINTSADELNFKFTSPQQGTFGSNLEDKDEKKYTMYSFRVIPVAIFTGNVVDSVGNPLESKINWTDNSDGTENGNTVSALTDGSYYFDLPLNKIYTYNFAKENYVPYAKEVDLLNLNDSIKVDERIILRKVPIKVVYDPDTSIIVRERKKVIVEKDAEVDNSEVKADENIPKPIPRTKVKKAKTITVKEGDYRFVKWNVLTNGEIFVIQISAWKTEGKAQSVADYLAGKNYDARIVKSDVPGIGWWYRVHVGKFATMEEAEKYSKQNYSGLYKHEGIQSSEGN